MRDLVLFLHVISGLALIAFPIIILQYKKNATWIKLIAVLTAVISWILIFAAGKLYVVFYPATKTLIKAGSWVWAHSILMETKEHWGLLIPLIATVAAGLVVSDKLEKSRKWCILLIVLAVLSGILGRLIVMGAGK